MHTDLPTEIKRLTSRMRQIVSEDFHRQGAVVAVSGGVDSATCLLLCVQALGPERVLALFLPDRTTSADSERLAREVAVAGGVDLISTSIAPALEALDAYRIQEEAIRAVIPQFDNGWGFKVVLPSILDSARLNLPRIVAKDPLGKEHTKRLPKEAYLRLIAAANYKQRIRTAIAYFHADRLNYAVCGTPNRLEFDQGFFVKGGDGLADFKPIAHLYKTQVYALAGELDVPQSILTRTPTTDTFSLHQSQEEFYFSVPLDVMDICLFGFNQGFSEAEVAAESGLSAEQVKRVWEDIKAKRRATAPLHRSGILFEHIEL